jgi:hypothetical protein
MNLQEKELLRQWQKQKTPHKEKTTTKALTQTAVS